MSEEKKPGRIAGVFKMAVGGFLAMCTGAVAMYSNALFNQVVRPTKPVANFSVTSTEGLTGHFKNLATGDSGWWDFGDGSPLEPFDPKQETVSHAFPKPGSYKVNLTVRNFLMEENDRSVTADLTAPASSPTLLPPSIANWKVESVGSPNQSPATYLVTADLQNTDELVWRYGDTTEHLTVQSGKIEKCVRLDKPGPQPIVLTALSKAKLEPKVMVHTVTVSGRTNDVYDVMLSVDDYPIRKSKQTQPQTVPFPVQDKGGVVTRGFERVITPSGPNAVILDVQLADKQPKKAVRKDRTKIEKSPDGKSVKVSGEWTLSGRALQTEAGGSDLPVVFLVTEEVTEQLSPTHSVVSGNLDPRTFSTTLRLPPVPATGVRREFTLDFGELTVDGKRTRLAQGKLDANGNGSLPFQKSGRALQLVANAANGALTVGMRDAASAPAPTPAPAPAPPPAVAAPASPVVRPSAPGAPAPVAPAPMRPTPPAPKKQ